MTDSLTGLEDSTFAFSVTTEVDCSTTTLSTPTTISGQSFDYRVGSDPKNAANFDPTVNDSISVALSTQVCGAVEYKLELVAADGVTLLLRPTWVTFDMSATNYAVIDGAMMANLGTHQFTLTAFLQDYPAVEQTMMDSWLTVNVLCEIDTLALDAPSNLIPASFDYTIGSTKEFAVQTYTVGPDPTCAHTLDFHLEIDGDPTAKIPDFIILDASGSSLSIYGTDNSEAPKSYSVRVVATEPGSGIWNSDVLFTVNTIVNCFFETVLDPEVGFSLTQELNYEIGSLPAALKIDTAFRDSLSAL